MYHPGMWPQIEVCSSGQMSTLIEDMTQQQMVESMQERRIALKERADQSLAECHEIRMSCVGMQTAVWRSSIT